eukprot:jgi/Mesen1/3313/ME000191S02450
MAFATLQYASAIISYTCTDGSKYTIKVESGQGQVAYGPEAFLTYKKLGLARIRVFACPLAKSNPGGKHWCGVKPALVGKVGVTVVYVRREIRSMSAADRQDYFDAVKTMAALTGAQGRKKYGAGFFNYYEMVSRHAAFLYTQPCDLAHLGPAFMPVHRSFTNEFNRVIQVSCQLAGTDRPSGLVPSLAAFSDPHWRCISG